MAATKSKVRYRVGRAANRLLRGRLHRHATARVPGLVTRDLVCPRWPRQLDGLRIAHLSDFHVGELLSPQQALRIVEDLQSLDADLLAVTGDIVDFHLDGIEPLLEALAQFPTPLGAWAVLGNHDHLVSASRFLAVCRAAGLRTLVNETVTLTHRGADFTLAGIDWARKRDELEQMVGATLGGDTATAPVVSDSESVAFTHGPNPTVLLAHHPDAFDAAWARGVDLTLSGHTHGGQLNLLDPKPWRHAVGIGSLTHRYSWGVYRRGASTLHVTAGVGSWFPFRVRCPSEVALLTVRSGNAVS